MIHRQCTTIAKRKPIQLLNNGNISASESRLQDSRACSPVFAGVVPLYLADNCLLSDCDRHILRSSSNNIRTLVIPQKHSKFETGAYQLLVHKCGPILHQNFSRHSCHLTFSGVKDTLRPQYLVTM